jgi:OOP family OmpA-OmpF porin
MRMTVLALLAVSGPTAALDIALPEGAAIVAATPPGTATHRIATGTWDGTGVPTADVTGVLRAAIWQVPDAGDLSIGTVAAGIERQLRDQGYRIDLSCADRTCGGFDFRRSLDMGQSPEMYVDIGNFHYISASGDSDGEAAAITVSRGGQTLYIHAVHIGASAGGTAWSTPPGSTLAGNARPADTTTGIPVTDAIMRLAELGAVPLDDLGFRTGASELSGEDFPSLVALAAFLAENPARRVVLVGHTDAQGGRDSNIALSQARAEAVRRHLIDSLGVSPAQLDAAGIGYLAPRATNETADGREANRRVEVVLLSDG